VRKDAADESGDGVGEGGVYRMRYASKYSSLATAGRQGQGLQIVSSIRYQK
jgi:hypothetical protein